MSRIAREVKMGRDIFFDRNFLRNSLIIDSKLLECQNVKMSKCMYKEYNKKYVYYRKMNFGYISG